MGLLDKFSSKHAVSCSRCLPVAFHRKVDEQKEGHRNSSKSIIMRRGATNPISWLPLLHELSGALAAGRLLRCLELSSNSRRRQAAALAAKQPAPGARRGPVTSR